MKILYALPLPAHRLRTAVHVDDWDQHEAVKEAGVRVDAIDGEKVSCKKPATKRTAPRNKYTGMTLQESWWKIRKNGYRNVSYEVRLDGLEYICNRVFTSDRRCAEQRRAQRAATLKPERNRVTSK